MTSYRTTISWTFLVSAWAALLGSAAGQDSRQVDKQLRWLDNFVAAEAEARRTRRPILVHAFDSI